MACILRNNAPVTSHFQIMCLKTNRQTSVSVRELLKIAHLTLLMELFICSPPVLCALFTFSFVSPVCYLLSCHCHISCSFFLLFSLCEGLTLKSITFFRLLSRTNGCGLVILSIYCTISSLYFSVSHHDISIFQNPISISYCKMQRKVLFFSGLPAIFIIIFFFTHGLSKWVSFSLQTETDRNEIHFLKAGTLCTSCEMRLLFRKV